MAKMCEMCHKKPAKRVTILYMVPNEHVGFFKNFLRRHWKNLAGRKSYVCEDCFFESSHGLSPITCSKCKKSFKINMEDFYDSKDIYCAFCGDAIHDYDNEK